MFESSSPTNPAQLSRYAAFARWGTLLLLLIMFTGTHLPLANHQVASNIPHVDKVLHAMSYMALALSALASWELTIGLLQPPHYFAVWLLGTLYGAFDEVTQIPVGRACDGLDWMSDILGLVLGLILFRTARPLLYRFLWKNR